jgi:hypothetical protein
MRYFKGNTDHHKDKGRFRCQALRSGCYGVHQKVNTIDMGDRTRHETTYLTPMTIVQQRKK